MKFVFKTSLVANKILLLDLISAEFDYVISALF